jgi:Xaa-Pro aminopeptidase
MRLVKSPAEIELMQKAAEITREAHQRTARLAWPGRYEYELEAELAHVFRARGGWGPAYGSIVGGGVNATTLHYVRNDQLLAKGEAVLIDAGVEYQGYASDVTRTYPIGGRFEPATRDLYELVLEAQHAAFEASGPGRTLPEIHQAALRKLVEGMLTLGLLEGEVDGLIESEAYRTYYMHGTSHWLGLDVHDVGPYVRRKEDGQTAPRPLVPGMSYTIEPGIYVAKDDAKAPEAFRGIGIWVQAGG